MDVVEMRWTHCARPAPAQGLQPTSVTPGKARASGLPTRGRTLRVKLDIVWELARPAPALRAGALPPG